MRPALPPRSGARAGLPLALLALFVGVGHEADGARWAAVRMDSAGILFEPLQGASNAFRWTRLTDSTWEAVLRFGDGGGARYELTRIGD